MILIYLLCISISMSFLIDYSGIIESFESFVRKCSSGSLKFFKVPKPFSCSLCMTFWIGLTLLILESANVTHLDPQSGFNVAYPLALVLACVLTSFWQHLFWFIQDFMQQIINFFRRWTGIQ